MTRIALAILLTVSAPAFALDPSLDISQYAHTSWTIREGMTAPVNAVAQTADGYLWLGTDFGLLRFDGVRAVPWEPPGPQHLPSSEIRNLLGARDGTLWIGTGKGLASWKEGRLTHYAELDGAVVGALLEDRDGAIWTSRLRTTGNGVICKIRSGRASCEGDDGRLGFGTFRLYQDRQGNIWVGTTQSNLWRWAPGVPQLFPIPGNSNAIGGFAEDERGALLLATDQGLQRRIDSRIERVPLPGVPGRPSMRRLLRDRDGGLWIAVYGSGLLHLHGGRVDRYTKNDGLSSDLVASLFEDREGNIWVATRDGFDRFRQWAVPTLSAPQGLASGPTLSLAAGSDGSVWLAMVDGLRRWRAGQVSTYLASSGLPSSVQSQYVDRRGRHWVGTGSGVGILDRGRFVRLPAVTAMNTHAIVEDVDGNVWIADQEQGLFRVAPDGVVNRIPASASLPYALAVAGDPAGGIWLGLVEGGIAYYADNQVRVRYGTDDGLGAGTVTALRFDRQGALWIATQGGLGRLKDGRIATLSRRNGLPCDVIHWTLEDDVQSLWMYTACGLLRLPMHDIDAWVADPQRNVSVTTFGPADGVRTAARPGYYTPQAAKSVDGRLWFATGEGVSVVDPGRLALNTIPPPVYVEQVVADGQIHDVAIGSAAVRLPPLTRSLQIDYTALSLVAPERVLFRYRLEGRDADWREAGNRRQAFYDSLPPGDYRFRVIASNNSGVWNETGDSLDFAIAPAYYQTAWFQVLVVGMFLTLLATLYQLRVRQVARQYNARLEARVSERTRIARDLHDTLLQSFQGVLLKFHAVSYKLGDHPDARQDLEAAVDQARQAIIEGRDAVQGLRASTLPGNDLARAIITFGDELAGANGSAGAELHVQVEGASRDLASLVHDDVYRIGCEAVRNAYKHAGARQIEVEIHYDQRQLRLRIRDDGKGIEAGVLRQGARAGHYGLPGMQERASAIGGKLMVWSELNSGTEVELTVPAAIAYARTTASHSSTLAGSGA